MRSRGASKKLFAGLRPKWVFRRSRSEEHCGRRIKGLGKFLDTGVNDGSPGHWVCGGYIRPKRTGQSVWDICDKMVSRDSHRVLGSGQGSVEVTGVYVVYVAF